MRMVTQITRTNVSLGVLTFVFFCALFAFRVSPTKAEESDVEMVWVLTETLINPFDAREDFIGGGAQSDWFVEARFEGTFVRYAVTETSFRIDDRFVDHEYEYHNVTVETFFEKPPLELNPGETVELIFGFSHSGTAEDGGTRAQFWYGSEDVDIQPDYAFAYAPWAEGFDGKTDGTYSFSVPPASSGREIEIWASWWNAEPCLVVWRYQAQEVGGTAGEDAAPDQVEEPVLVIPDQEAGQGRELGAAQCARMQQEVADQAAIARGPKESDLKLGIIGEVVVQHGSAVHDYCTGGEGSLSESSQIKIGDCIRTNSDGDLIVRLNDWNEDRNIGASIILVAADSELCFDEFFVATAPARRTTLITLIEGALRAITKGWKNGSIFKVKAGTTICGGRGTEFFVSYLPDVDLFYAQLFEGQLDVSSAATGEAATLSDKQNLVISNGEMVLTGPITQEQWDANLEDAGLRLEDFPEFGSIDDETIIEDVPDIGDIEGGPVLEPESQFPPINLVLILCSALLCVVVLIVIAVGIVILVRRRSKT